MSSVPARDLRLLPGCISFAKLDALLKAQVLERGDDFGKIRAFPQVGGPFVAYTANDGIQ
jgi:hypothetical protein